MRVLVLALVSCVLGVGACKTTHPGAGGLTREQCSAFVRKENKIRTSDTGGLGVAMQSKERTSVEECLTHATPQAYRCVMQAETKSDLETCERSMR